MDNGGKKDEPAEKADDKSKNPPPPPVEDDDIEDGDIADVRATAGLACTLSPPVNDMLSSQTCRESRTEIERMSPTGAKPAGAERGSPQVAPPSCDTYR